MARGELLASVLLIARPGIAAGVTLAGLSGMVLAQGGVPPVRSAILGLSCTLLSASGSAVLNGVLESGRDTRMLRLSTRVSALEKVGRRGAIALSLALIAASLTVSALFLNAVATVLLLAAVVSYTLLYTLLLKRISPYGTVPGGIPGALPVLIGYAAIDPRLGLDGLALFLLMLLWQPPHFWTLALKYREDYRSAGLPVMPVVLGEPYTKILIFLYAASLLPMSLALWWLGYCSIYYGLAALLLGGFFLLSCYRNLVSTRRFGRAFGASIVYLMGLLFAVIADVSFHIRWGGWQ